MTDQVDAVLIRARRVFEASPPSKRKRYGRVAKAEQNFDPNPPACRNCRAFVKQEIVWVAELGKKRWAPPFCSTGSFTCTPEGVCDEWTGKDGAKLL